MAETSGPVALKLGNQVLVKIRTNTTVKDLLEQLDKACKGGRLQVADGFDVTAQYSQSLPEKEYAIKQSTTNIQVSTQNVNQYQEQEVSLACCLLFPKENGRILKTLLLLLPCLLRYQMDMVFLGVCLQS